MRILIVDDNLSKITELTELINSLSNNLELITTENVSNAIELLKNTETFNLAIIDILLPLRPGDNPIKNGGQILLNEIYRKKDTLKTPNYIIGLTQYPEYKVNFHSIWKVVEFSFIENKWRQSIKDLIEHINSTNVTILSNDRQLLPTIYVEGVTDLDYLNLATNIFFPQYSNKFNILSQKNAGANWVTNQVAIWAIAKKKDTKGQHIIALGLLDSDDAGNKSKENLIKRIQTPNENNCFKIIQINQKYNDKLIEFYKNGCKIEIEIESLFPIEILEHADEQGWLEHRTSSFVENPSNWKQYEQSSKDYILNQGIEEKHLIYLKKVKRENKEDFSKYVLKLANRNETFSNFKLLIEDLLKGLKIL